MSWLYLVTHRSSDRAYVGWTSMATPEERWALHRRDARRRAQQYFLRALALYGPDAFEWQVVQWFDTDDEAKLAEVYWIERLGTNHCNGGHGYNMTDGGEGASGYRHDAERRLKISAGLRGKPLSAEHRMKISTFQRGQKRAPCPEETKAKISAAQAGREGRPMDAEHKAKLVAFHTGRKRSEETKRRIREGLADRRKRAG